MTGPVRKRRQQPVFDDDQRETLRWELGDEYEQLLPILEKVAAGYRARRALPSIDDEIRAHTQAAEDLVVPCLRFLADLEKATPRWREVQQWSFGPPLTSAELEERMSALNKSRSVVETLLKQARAGENIGSRLRPRKPGKQTDRRAALARYVGVQMIIAGIKLTKYAKVKAPSGKFANTLKVVYNASGETVVDIYPDVARAIEALEGLEELYQDVARAIEALVQGLEEG